MHRSGRHRQNRSQDRRQHGDDPDRPGLDGRYPDGSGVQADSRSRHRTGIGHRPRFHHSEALQSHLAGWALEQILLGQRDRNRPADPVQFRRLERDRKIRTALRNHRRGCGPRDMVVRKCGLRADRRRIRPEQISDLFHPDRPRRPAGGQTRNQIDRDVRFGPEHADRRREPVHRNVRRYAGYQKSDGGHPVRSSVRQKTAAPERLLQLRVGRQRDR